jgi:hypothetical protein
VIFLQHRIEIRSFSFVFPSARRNPTTGANSRQHSTFPGCAASGALVLGGQSMGEFVLLANPYLVLTPHLYRCACGDVGSGHRSGTFSQYRQGKGSADQAQEKQRGGCAPDANYDQSELGWFPYGWTGRTFRPLGEVAARIRIFRLVMTYGLSVGTSDEILTMCHL